jgi:hypothetical protein
MKNSDTNADYGTQDLYDMFDYIKSEFEFAGKDTSNIDAFVNRLQNVIDLKKQLSISGGSDLTNIGASETNDEIQNLRDQITALKDELQGFKNLDITPNGVESLRDELDHTQKRADDLELALLHMDENTVDLESYRELSDELSSAKVELIDL